LLSILFPTEVINCRIIKRHKSARLALLAEKCYKKDSIQRKIWCKCKEKADDSGDAIRRFVPDKSS
jgi:hypothetical protein